MEQFAQRGAQCPIPEKIQGFVGWSSEQPDVVVEVPGHCRGLDKMILKVPSNPNHSIFLVLHFCITIENNRIESGR